MRIEWVLDDTYDPKDPDILGTIVLHDEGGGTITQEATYIDSWLYALLQGVRVLRTADVALVDLVEEPDQLEMLRAEDGIVLSYRGNAVITESLAEITEATRNALERFLDIVGSAADRESEMIGAFRDFLDSYEQTLSL